VQEKHAGRQLNGTCQLLVHGGDVNLLGDNICRYREENTQTLIDASKEAGLEVKTEKTKYQLVSRYKNAGQYHDIEIGNICF
jgi:hypothetical protein